MRIARFWHDGQISYGLVLGAGRGTSETPGGAARPGHPTIEQSNAPGSDAPQPDAPQPNVPQQNGTQSDGTQSDGTGSANGFAATSASGTAAGATEQPNDELTVAQLTGHPFGGRAEDIKLTGVRFPLRDIRLLAPILPSKVICVGQNFAEHAREMGDEPPTEPVIFLKPSTAVCGPGDPILRPSRLSHRVDYEGELAVVIGRLCQQVTADRVAEVIFGYTCANDVTARDLQARDGQWTRAKGFDTFCPLGPWIETDADPADLEITTRLNGEIKQHSRTSMMIHDAKSLVMFVSQVMTLVPGDVLLTGTPSGVGPLEKDDEVSVTIDGIGTLSNLVSDRD